MSKAWWVKNVHMHIDMETFTVYVNAAARDVAVTSTCATTRCGLP